MQTANPDVFVTNFNRNFTGVSSTASSVFAVQSNRMAAALVGYPLPSCSAPLRLRDAIRLSRVRPHSRPFYIWHVRRNTEMWAAIFARDVLRLPIRILFTSAAQRLHSAVPRILISRMDAVISTSREAAAFMSNNWKTIPHGVDVKRFSPSENRVSGWKSLGLPGSKGIVAIGRIRPEKGTDLFIDAAILALRKNPELTAVVIGKAKRDHQSFLKLQKEKIAASGLTERFVFMGEVAPGRLPSILREMSLVVALPRYEGYGMTPLEGMACGVPFVATAKTGYFTTFACNGACGLVFQETDAESVSTCITNLLNDPERYNAMSKAARYHAEKKFSVEQEAEEIMDVYERLWAGETKLTIRKDSKSDTVTM